MRKNFISLFLICGLMLTACTNSCGRGTTLTETISATLAEAGETAQESETEAENAPPEFTGVEISDEAIENFSIEEDSSGGYHIFCYNEDMVYFSDINDGWRLYSYDGENVSLILDQQAYYLYYYDNCIYFLSDRNVDALNNDKDGFLYKYDIESKEVTKLTDEMVYLPRVDETGIYYSKKYEGKFYIYRLDEESGEDERLYEGYAYYRIGDYEISREEIGKKGQNKVYDYFLLKNDEKICFLSETTVFYDFIHAGVFYYKASDLKMHTIDLKTGEKNILPISSRVTFLGDEMYYCADDPIGCYSIYRWNDAEPELIYLIGRNLPFDTGFRGNWEDHDILGHGVYGLQCVYSDNKTLYAYVYPSNVAYEFHLAKVGPLDDGSGDYIIDPIH